MIELFAFLILTFMSYLYILEINPLSVSFAALYFIVIMYHSLLNVVSMEEQWNHIHFFFAIINNVRVKNIEYN